MKLRVTPSRDNAALRPADGCPTVAPKRRVSKLQPVGPLIARIVESVKP